MDTMARWFLPAKILGGFPLKVVKRKKRSDDEVGEEEEGGVESTVGLAYDPNALAFLLVFLSVYVGLMAALYAIWSVFDLDFWEYQSILRRHVGITQSLAVVLLSVPQMASYFTYFFAYRHAAPSWSRLVGMVDGASAKYLKHGTVETHQSEDRKFLPFPFLVSRRGQRGLVLDQEEAPLRVRSGPGGLRRLRLRTDLDDRAIL